MASPSQEVLTPEATLVPHYPGSCSKTEAMAITSVVALHWVA